MSKIFIPISELRVYYLTECKQRLSQKLNDFALWGKEADEYEEVTPTLAGFIAYCRPFFNSERFTVMHTLSKQKNATKTDNI